MAKSLFARIAGAFAVTLLALFFVSVLPLLSAARTTQISIAPGVTVNPTFKGDRLPLHTALGPSVLQSDFDSLSKYQTQNQKRAQMRAEAREEIPFACDPSFSPVATPRLAYIYGRCMS
jgi:hypothetical protein